MIILHFDAKNDPFFHCFRRGICCLEGTTRSFASLRSAVDEAIRFSLLIPVSLLFHPVSLAAKVFRFPKVIGFQSYGVPKAALVFQRGFGVHQRAYSELLPVAFAGLFFRMK